MRTFATASTSHIFESVFISLTKTTTKNNRQQTFFLWLRRDVDELKLISDDKNYDEMYDFVIKMKDASKMHD